jgi:AraC family transcriptional regulator, arabinose operon regulatory protein
MMFVTFPNRRIHYEADPDSIWTIYWVCIGSEKMESYLDSMQINLDNPTVQVSLPYIVEKVFDSLLSRMDCTTLQSNFECMSLIYNLLSLMTNPSLALESNDDYIEQAINYIQYTYDKPITSKDIANHLSIDRGYFSKLFKEKTGITPTQWILNVRMEKATHFLINSDLSIKEIAHSVGIFDQLYFSRLFVKMYGLCPKMYRETNLPSAKH